MVVRILAFIYLGEECLVISYSASVLTLWSWTLILSPVSELLDPEEPDEDYMVPNITSYGITVNYLLLYFIKFELLF